MLKNSLEKTKMSDVQTAGELIKSVLPREHRSVSEWIRDTHHTLRRDAGEWTYSRVQSIWYGNAAMVHAWQMDSLRRAAAKRRDREQNAAKRLEAARAEFRALTQTSRMASALAHTDESFHRPTLDALAAIAARWIAPEIEE